MVSPHKTLAEAQSQCNVLKGWGLGKFSNSWVLWKPTPSSLGYSPVEEGFRKQFLKIFVCVVCLCTCMHMNKHDTVHMWRSEDNRWGRVSSSATWDTGMELGWVRLCDKCLYLLSHLTSPRRHTVSHDIINLTFPIPPILYYQKELTAVSLIGKMMSLACFSKLKVNNL